MAALRRDRDRAMVEAMVLGGLRRCEVLGLRLEDLHVGERRVFVAEGKGGHQRSIPMSSRFFVTVARYLDDERPAGSVTERVFVVLKGPNRGGRYRPRASMRSSTAPAAGPGCRMAPVMSYAIPV